MSWVVHCTVVPPRIPDDSTNGWSCDAIISVPAALFSRWAIIPTRSSQSDSSVLRTCKSHYTLHVETNGGLWWLHFNWFKKKSPHANSFLQLHLTTMLESELLFTSVSAFGVSSIFFTHFVKFAYVVEIIPKMLIFNFKLSNVFRKV